MDNDVMLPRQRATEERDLPHRFVPDNLGWCKVCRGHVVEEQHTLWERAMAAPPDEPTVPREHG